MRLTSVSFAPCSRLSVRLRNHGLQRGRAPVYRSVLALWYVLQEPSTFIVHLRVACADARFTSQVLPERRLAFVIAVILEPIHNTIVVRPPFFVFHAHLLIRLPDEAHSIGALQPRLRRDSTRTKLARQDAAEKCSGIERSDHTLRREGVKCERSVADGAPTPPGVFPLHRLPHGIRLEHRRARRRVPRKPRAAVHVELLVRTGAAAERTRDERRLAQHVAEARGRARHTRCGVGRRGCVHDEALPVGQQRSVPPPRGRSLDERPGVVVCGDGGVGLREDDVEREEV